MTEHIDQPFRYKPLLLAACVPVILLVLLHGMVSHGLAPIPAEVGLQSLSFVGRVWYFTSLPLVWLTARLRSGNGLVVLAAVVPPLLVHALLFWVGTLDRTPELVPV